MLFNFNKNIKKGFTKRFLYVIISKYLDFVAKFTRFPHSCRRIYKRRVIMIDKKAIIAEYGKNEKDTGSTEVQIALLTARINNLTEHLKNNKQDKHSTRGLQMMNSQRRALLRYLEQEDIERCRAIKKKLGLRG